MAAQRVKEACEIRDDGDIFDSIVMAEDRLVDESYKEGFSVGKEKGFKEGHKLGLEKGEQVGRELGFYSGFVTTYKKLLDSEGKTKERTLKALNSLEEMIAAFPVGNPANKELFEQLERLRAKFKQVTSLLNVQPTFGSKETKGFSF